MAHANFIDRALTSASQVLQQFDPTAYKHRLETHPVGVAFDLHGVDSPEGAATLDLLVRLLARLYPALVLSPLHRRASSAATTLGRLARSINPAIDIKRAIGIERAPKDIGTWIIVGATRVDHQTTPIYVGSNGWITRVSSRGPIGSGGASYPFGAGAAACFAVANLFRIVFADQLEKGERDGEISFSTFDYSADANPELGEVDLGEAHLVGIGAIGNGTVWALGRAAGLSGTLHLIDSEPVDISNLQRYVLATQKDVEKSKVAIAVEHLKGLKLVPSPHPQKWANYLGERNDWRLDRVAVAVDTERDRIAIQSALPRWVANAWTQPGDLGVSRHDFASDAACMCCLYMPTEKMRNEDEVVRDALRLPADQQTLMQVRELLDRGTPVGAEFVARIATGFDIEPEKLMRFADRPLRSFYTEAVCGGVVFTLSEGRHRVPAVVPLAFQSALAGILLAGELVSNAAALKPDPQPVKATIDLLRPLPKRVTIPIKREPTGRCICHDEDFQAAYRSKYAVG